VQRRVTGNFIGFLSVLPPDRHAGSFGQNRVLTRELEQLLGIWAWT